jgi:hypothetical protein
MGQSLGGNEGPGLRLSTLLVHLNINPFLARFF